MWYDVLKKNDHETSSCLEGQKYEEVSGGGRAMVKGIHNYSEIGKLKKVLLHRIGSEVDGLVPANFERLLFDDIPYLKVA